MLHIFTLEISLERKQASFWYIPPRGKMCFLKFNLNSIHSNIHGAWTHAQWEVLTPLSHSDHEIKVLAWFFLLNMYQGYAACCWFGLGAGRGVPYNPSYIMIKEKTPQNFDQLEKPSVKFSNHAFSPWGWTNQPNHRGGRLGFFSNRTPLLYSTCKFGQKP